MPGQGDPSGQPLVRAFGVTDLIEPIDLFLQLLRDLRQGLLVEEEEPGPTEALILALRGRPIGFAGDRLHQERGDIRNELAEDSAAGGVQRPPLSLSNRCGTP